MSAPGEEAGAGGGAGAGGEGGAGAGGGAGSNADALTTILDAEGLTTSTSEPEPLAWVGDVSQRAVDEAFGGALPTMAASSAWLAGVVLGAAVLLAVGIVAALVIRLVRAPAGPRPRSPAARPLPAPVPPASLGEVESLLGAGDAPGALRALWRWVGARIEARGYARPSPDRTNRELFAEVRRAAPGWERLPALGRLTTAVDAHLYGGVPLDPAAVRALVPLAQEVVQ